MRLARSSFLALLLGALGATAPASGQSAAAEPAGARDVSILSLPNANANSTSNYTAENLLADLAQQLTERYRVSGELQVDLLRAWSPPTVNQPVSLVVLDAPAVLGSTLLVHFRLQSGRQIVAETSLLVRVQLMRDVWCARAPADRGSALDSTQFDTRRVDTLRERDTIAASETMSDLTLARTVAAGRILSWHDVARRALVRKGQIIDVTATSSGLTVNMKALAMENGTAGETVRVRNLDSKKEFPAIVVAESRAEVRL